MYAIILAILMVANPAFAQEPALEAEAEVPAAPEAEEAEAEAPEAEAPEAEAAEAEEAEAVEKVEQLVIEPPENSEEALEDAQDAVSAAQKGMWGTFGALIMGLFVFVWNKFFAGRARREEGKPE